MAEGGKDYVPVARHRKGGYSRSALLETAREARLDETGLYSRKYFDLMSKNFKAQEKRGARFGILFLDLDDLKKINDSEGHEAGDMLIRKAASIIRKEDFGFRYGGDEFVIVYHYKKGVGDLIDKRIRKDLGSINISMGRAETGEGVDFDKALKEADRLMYEEKRLKKENKSDKK